MSEIDFRKLTSADLVEMIKTESGGLIDEEQLTIQGMNKWALVKIYKSLKDTSDSTVETNDDKTSDEPEEIKTIPLYLDQDWPDYVMSQFGPKELVPDKKGNKNPNIAGLRRVAQLLLGEIISSKPTEVKGSLNAENPGRSIVTYEIVFNWMNSGLSKTFGSTAGAWPGNTDDEFMIFPEAIAETRAEGRTLRKALGIHTVCADELVNKDTTDIIERFKDKLMAGNESDGFHPILINDLQVKMINTMCDRMKINTEKFINSGDRIYSSIKEIPYEKAIAMIKKLNQFQNVNETEIPIELKEN